jgi:nucleoid-associated protein YgaU
MFASPYLRRRASALAVFVSVVALGFLALPGSSSGARPARQHVVQPGETLWAIAGAAYGGGDTDSHVQAIARASHLHSSLIVPGQRLVLP